MSSDNGAGGVYAKVQKVSADLEEIPKTGYNEHFGYKYHEADKVMAELRPLLAEHGLVIIPHQVGIEDVAVTTSNGEAFLTTVKHELEVVDTEDGSSLTFTVFGRGQDSSDKGPTKAYTMAYKYGVMKLFGIASSQSDPDAGAPAERATSNGDDSPFDCPECGGPVWDNTDDPKAALNEGEGNRPSYKCKDDDCDWATWPSDEDTLDEIGQAVSELNGWDKEAGDKAGRLVSAKQDRLHASQDFADSVLGKIERRIEDAKDAVEEQADAEQGDFTEEVDG